MKKLKLKFNKFKDFKDKIWFKLRLKSNEFDNSLNFDSTKYEKMTDKKRIEYTSDLIKRRNLAHELSESDWK